MLGSSERSGSGVRTPGPRALLLVTGLLALLFFSGSLLAPLLAAWDVPGGGLLRLLYAPVCHQKAERCLTIAILPSAACARCSGLYLGGAIGLLACGLLARGRFAVRPVWFLIAVVPTLVDAIAGWIGLPSLSNAPRFWMSVPTGVVIGVFLAIGLDDLARLLQERRAERPGPGGVDGELCNSRSGGN